MTQQPSTVGVLPIDSHKPKGTGEYWTRIPARFYKDELISPEAKALLGIIVSFADGHSNETFVSNSRLRKLMRRGRAVLDRTIHELRDLGWLRIEPRRGPRGRFGGRILIWSVPDRCSSPPQRYLTADGEQDHLSVTKLDQVNSPEKL
jgi:hypothetical protein